MGKIHNTIIESWGIYLPEKTVTSSEVMHGCRSRLASHLPLERFTGIHTRHVVGENQFSLELAQEAIERCLQTSAYDPKDIDMVIAANISKSTSLKDVTIEPTHAGLLCERFGLKGALAFDVTNACAGVFTALMIADRFIQSGSIRRALVVSGEYISHISNSAQQEIEGIRDPRLACLTVGDAGVCLLLEGGADAGEGFDHIGMHTIPEHADLCIAYFSDYSHGGIMLTDSVKLAQQAEREGHMLHTYISESGLVNPSPPFVIPHQTSSHAIKQFIRYLNRMSEKRRYNNKENFLDNLYHRGNTATTSHWVALNDFMSDGRLKEYGHDQVLFSVLASGITVGIAQYTGLDRMHKRLASQSAEPYDRSPIDSPHLFVKIPTEKRIRIKQATTNCEPAIEKSSDQTINNNVKLAEGAATRALSMAGDTADALKALIYCGVYRERALGEPALATLLARHMNIHGSKLEKGDRQFFAFDLIDGAPAVIRSIMTAAYLPLSDSALTMVATSEYVDFNVEYVSEGQVEFAKIGSAILLEQSDDNSGFYDFCFAHYPQYINDYAVKLHSERQAQSEKSDGKLHRVDREYRFGISGDLNQHYLECISDTVRAFLQHVDLSADDIDIVFPPHISPAFTTQLAAAINIPEERMVQSDIKHPFTATAAAAWEALPKDAVQKGRIGMFISVGAGIQVACALYAF